MSRIPALSSQLRRNGLALAAGGSALVGLALLSRHDPPAAVLMALLLAAVTLSGLRALRKSRERERRCLAEIAALRDAARLYEQARAHNEALETRDGQRTVEIAQLNTRLETILNTSSDAIALISAAGHVRQANQTFVQWFGFTPADAPANWSTFADPAQRLLLETVFQRVLATGRARRMEVAATTVDGRLLDLEVALARAGDTAPDRDNVVCTLRDISALKRAEATQETLATGLRTVVTSAYELLSCAELDDLYRRAVEIALTRLGLERCALYLKAGDQMTGTFGTDHEGRVVDERAHTRRIAGLPWTEHFVAFDPAQVFWVSSETPLTEWDGQQVVNIGLTTWNVTTPVLSPQGLVGYFFNDPGRSGRPLDPATQEIVYLYCTLLGHLIARKQLEQALREALEKEMQLNELKTRFVSMVSHEFRTPLAVIQSSGDLLTRYYERMTAERRQEHVTSIHQQIHHLTRLLDDILAISRSESVGLEAQLAPVDLPALVEAAMKDVMAGRIQPRIRLIVTDSLPALRLDPRLMRQAVTNLLTNALKYSEGNAPVEVRLGCAGDQIVLTVRDCGIGIPEADRARIFEMFHRAPNAEFVPGTGLGLTIVRLVVELHGGAVTFESQPGQGTCFTITLPLVAAEPHFQNLTP